jgi:hypothetical protein
MSITPEHAAQGLANLIEFGIALPFAWVCLKITRRFTDPPPDFLKRLQEFSQKQ